MAISAGGDANIQEEIPESRRVGQQDWHIVFEDESESELWKRVRTLENEIVQVKSEVVQVKSDREKDARIWGNLYIRNAVSEALLFALCEQPKAAGHCWRFRALAQESDPRVCHLVNLFNDDPSVPVSVDANSIATTLDKVIDSRNLSVHDSSMADVLLEVEEALSFLQRYPTLQGKFSKEYMVLSNYDKIRAAFKV